jgi:hypothetical protein
MLTNISSAPFCCLISHQVFSNVIWTVLNWWCLSPYPLGVMNKSCVLVLNHCSKESPCTYKLHLVIPGPHWFPDVQGPPLCLRVYKCIPLGLLYAPAIWQWTCWGVWVWTLSASPLWQLQMYGYRQRITSSGHPLYLLYARIKMHSHMSHTPLSCALVMHHRPVCATCAICHMF